GVDPETGPYGGQGSEDLVSVKPVAAVHSLGPGGREQHRKVVPAFTVAGGKDLSCRRLFEDPAEALVAAAPQVGGQAGPVDVHVERQSGGGLPPGPEAVPLADLGVGQAPA